MPGRLPEEAQSRASVRFLRFSAHPDRRSEVIDAASPSASGAGVPPGSDWRLLVELENGDWLEVSITSSGGGSDQQSAYLDMANGILGDEDGVIVRCIRLRGSD